MRANHCVAILVCSLFLLWATGCAPAEKESSHESPEISGEAAGAGVKVYTVRGQITQLPDPERPGSQLMVHHEMIPDFENAEGEVVGMNAMIMPFPLAEGLSLEGFEPGDKVEMTFEMRFKPKTFYEVTELSALPAETELDLGGMAGGDV